MAPQRPNALRKLADDSAYSKTAAEVLDWTYYDTIKLVSTTLVHRFFINPLGSGGKTLADTNLTLAGILPQGQNMKVKAIKLFLTGADAHTETDLLNIFIMLKNTTIEFVIPGKDSMGTWTLQEMFGISTAVQLTPSVAGDNIPMPQARYTSIFPLNKAIKIGATQAFEIRLTHHVAPNSGLDNDTLMVGLNGRLVRMS